MIGSPRPPSDGAFETLVAPHLDAAYNLARYLARDPVAADDIVQEAALRACRGLAGWRGGEGRAWFLTIVRRSFIDWANARRSGAAVIAEGEAIVEAPDDADDPEAALIRAGDIAQVRAAIEALPQPFREAIVLRELEGFSYREMAEVTGAPIGTVMSRLARGRDLLARRLAPPVRALT